jgi:curved DNA-binding protein CbpA
VVAVHKVSYYEVLGVSPDASLDQIRAVYHRLARIYHPDADSSNPAGEAKLKEINVAWTVLSDPSSRRRHDLALGIASTWSATGSTGGTPPGHR